MQRAGNLRESRDPSLVPRIALVVAVAENDVIGRAGGLPWHLPDDLKHFRAVTLGKPVLMGRRTFESIGRALPGRRNLVMSRAAGPGRPVAAAVEYVASLQEACERVRGAAELCVIGGAQVYAQALPLATLAYLTVVHASVSGDVRFPLHLIRDAAGSGSLTWPGWREVQRSEHPADERHAYAMSFVTLEKQAG